MNQKKLIKAIFISVVISFTVAYLLQSVLGNNTILVAVGGTIILANLIYNSMTRQKDITQRYKIVDAPAHGTARWGGLNDVADIGGTGWIGKNGEENGVLVGRIGDSPLRIKPVPPISPHNAIIGASGAGKTTGYVLPNIRTTANSGHSMVVSDPKGEIFDITSGYLEEQGYNVVKFDLQNLNAHRWSPVQEVKTDYEVEVLADVLVRNSVDKAGDKSAYFVALEGLALTAILHLAKSYGENSNMLDVMELLALDRESITPLVHDCDSEHAKNAWAQVATASNNPLVGLSAKLRVLRHIGDVISNSDFNLERIGQEKTAVFCIIPIADPTLKPVLAAFYLFLFRRLCSRKQDIPVKIILDEFANLGQVLNFEQTIAVARGYNVKIDIILQNISQLEDVYGFNARKAILSNCGVQLLLSTNDLDTAKYFSSLAGSTAAEEINIKPDNRSISGRRIEYSKRRRDLIEASEIMQMPSNEIIALISGKPPLALWKVNFFAESDCFAGYEPVHVPTPEPVGRTGIVVRDETPCDSHVSNPDAGDLF